MLWKSPSGEGLRADQGFAEQITTPGRPGNASAFPWRELGIVRSLGFDGRMDAFKLHLLTLSEGLSDFFFFPLDLDLFITYFQCSPCISAKLISL